MAVGVGVRIVEEWSMLPTVLAGGGSYGIPGPW